MNAPGRTFHPPGPENSDARMPEGSAMYLERDVRIAGPKGANLRHDFIGEGVNYVVLVVPTLVLAPEIGVTRLREDGAMLGRQPR